MAKSWAKWFYASDKWHRCRTSYIKSVGGLCERCLANGEYKPGWIVHHKTYLTVDNIHDPNITLNFDNLEYLCQDCHNKEHHRDETTTRQGLMFDEQGNLIDVNGDDNKQNYFN